MIIFEENNEYFFSTSKQFIINFIDYQNKKNNIFAYNIPILPSRPILWLKIHNIITFFNCTTTC